MSNDPIRAALERLINAVLDGLAQDDHPMGWARVDDAIAAARAALAAAPAEGACGSSIEELGPLIAWLTGKSVRAANAGLSEDAGMLCWAAGVVGERVDEDAPGPASAPLEGEVGELVAWLEGHAKHLRKMEEIGALPETELQEMLDRAAILLEQLSAAAPAMAPIPLSERLPGEGRCWWGDAGGAGFVPSWRLCEQPSAAEFTHWLPAHAIPLPAPQGGEVK